MKASDPLTTLNLHPHTNQIILNCQCRRCKDMDLIPGSGRCPGGGHGNPLQYSWLENPLDRGAWLATVHRAAKSWTWLKQLSTRTQREKTGSCRNYADQDSIRTSINLWPHLTSMHLQAPASFFFFFSFSLCAFPVYSKPSFPGSSSLRKL